MADHLTTHHYTHVTNRNLTKVYSDLLRALDRRNLTASFAFVGALTMNVEEYHAHPEFFGDSATARTWLHRFTADVNHGSTDGWFAPELLQAVLSEGRHEIASHGFSHLSLAESSTPFPDAERELQAVAWVSRQKGISPKTFVYPRNKVGYRELLRSFGYLGFRDRLPTPGGAVGKVWALTREFNLFAGNHSHSRPEHPVALPPGYFLNWRFGARKHVPVAVTVARWRRIIDDAVARNGVALMWLHPHNLIDGHLQLVLLEAVLDYVATLVHRGVLANCTQIEYATSVMNSGGEPTRIEKEQVSFLPDV